jgi:hypothetical protein
MNNARKKNVGVGSLLIAAGLGILLAAGTGLHLIPPPPIPADRLEMQARQFVILALSLARLDPKEIDAYYGPKALEAQLHGPAPSFDVLQDALARLRSDLESDASSLRRDRLRAKVGHLIALVGIIKAPRSLAFDEEARRVYGIALPPVDPARRRQVLAALDALLPGQDSLAMRVTAFNNRFVVPADKRRAVFARALSECRVRTLSHWPLPHGERLEIDWTGGVDAAWHRYQGRYRSLLQINPLAVAYLGSNIDVACHEAYPGHHAQFVTMAANAGSRDLSLEDTVVILRSPEQVLREGAANYGIDLAFPPQDRLAFERDVLFPIAGFPPKEAERYVQVHRLVAELALSVMPILRDYRDGKLSFDTAAASLEHDALISSSQALLQYTDALGAYTAGYTVARDLVRDCVEARSRATGRDRWSVLRSIVAKEDLSVLDSRTCHRQPGTSAANLVKTEKAADLDRNFSRFSMLWKRNESEKNGEQMRVKTARTADG